MSGFVGVNVSNCQEPDTDPSLRGQLTQVELQSLKAKLSSLKWDSGGRVTTKNLPGLMNRLRGLEVVSEEDVAAFLSESYPDDQEIDFEPFLQLYLDLQARVSTDKCGGGRGKTLFSLTKPMVQADKSLYVAHINTYLCEDPFLKNYLPIDPTGNQLFDLIRDGILLCKLINVAVPGTIDEKAINMREV